MAILNMTNTRIGTRGDKVVADVPVDGRRRTLIFDPVDAVQIANQIATAAVQVLNTRAPASLEAQEVRLKGYGVGGLAHLAVITAEHGPFVFALGSRDLNALAVAAIAALELAESGGSA